MSLEHAPLGVGDDGKTWWLIHCAGCNREMHTSTLDPDSAVFCYDCAEKSLPPLLYRAVMGDEEARRKLEADGTIEGYEDPEP